MSRQGICIFFMCSVIIISFRKSLQLYCDTSSLGREEQPHMEGGGGVNPQLPALAIYELFLNKESQDFHKFLAFFDNFLGCVLCRSSIDSHSFQ